MFSYYLDLALRSFKRSRGLTALMVITIAIGVGACMTTLTVFHVLSSDPLPHKSNRVFNIQMDPEPMRGYKEGDEPVLQLTRFDAEKLLREAHGVRQVMMSGGHVAIEPEGQNAFFATARYTSTDFFAMFDVPLQFGTTWNAGDDNVQARVVVLSSELNDRLFGGVDSIGRTVLVRGKEFRVVGVLKTWRPVPHFYDLTQSNFGKAEEIYMPFSTAMELKFGTSGNTNCWGDVKAGESRSVGTPCAWVQYWVELESPNKAGDYLQYLRNYYDQQKSAGRFERPTRVWMWDVMGWLTKREVVPSDIGLQLWLAFGFLVVCLVNTVGLLLAKCLRRSGEIGVRRALGASRSAIFAQFVVEAGSLGLAGGLLGLVLTWLGLWAVRNGSSGYAVLINLDGTMLATTLLLALAASLLAGLLPAWRACQVSPAMQLKTQ
ncbi:MAG: ABC transporter permease [Rhodoferax sp.]|nr:ABC transporter permease [Rhodoferax sp.]